MAATYQTYVSDGTTRQYAVPFPYLDQDHVRVSVDGVLQEGVVFLSSGLVQLPTAPDGGSIVEVRRKTPTGVIPVDFTDGSVLDETDLDTLAKYSAYLSEEAADVAAGGLFVGSDGNFNAQSRRITGVANGVSPDDAVNKAQLDALGTSVAANVWLSNTLLAQTETARAAAETARVGAVQAATLAETAKVGAETAAADATNLRADFSASSGSSLVGFQQAGSGSVARSLQDKARDVVSVKDFGATGDGVTDDGPAIRRAYAAARNIVWPAGTYRMRFASLPTSEQYVRVFSNTITRFEAGVVIQRDPASGTQTLFSNGVPGDSTTTAYNGAGNIRFHGPAVFELYGGVSNAPMQVYGMVHGRGFVADGGGIVRNWTSRHAVEMNAFADWRISDYTFQNQFATAGNEELSEVLHWDGSFDSGRFPFAPGAADSTTCRDFEISNCKFENVYTAYGAHHTEFGVKHLRPHIFNNTIIDAKSSAERLRHLQDGHVYGQVIQRCVDRASNVRECVNLIQDGYNITDPGQSGVSAVFWQTSQNCQWGPNSRIRYSGTGGQYTAAYEVGSSGLPSTNTTIYEGVVAAGTSAANPIIGDSGTNTRFIRTANTRPLAETWGSYFPALNTDAISSNGYMLLARVGDTTQAISGTFYARQRWSLGSGGNHAEVSVTSIAGTDGTRRTIWSQRMAVSTNAVTLEQVTWGGETWVAIHTNTTVSRAFASGATFTGFATLGANQFRVVPASEISGATIIATGVHQIGGDLSLHGGSAYPDADNNQTMGTATRRWSTVHAMNVRTHGTTVASLPTAASAGAGARAFVTNATATTFASIVAGGGSNGVPVYSDGTDWRIG